MAIGDFGPFKILLRTPFSRWPSSPPVFKSHHEAATWQRKPPELDTGLDIWRGPKVLSIEWDSRVAGSERIISFRRGAWEGEFLAIPEQPVAPQSASISR
ncbi:hypothetical protein HB662_01525 [Roseomonas frigidaquae]|uniref:Uncharacterized protein n=1 Tax=Falsiroseomonas frigidaquae TaxID=487318 RepID=A0ABX1ES29_9PROT|nr:hypothetical protein [Falsiroseomonas frigidaquae]NKE43439.1 hypothetical protein [Falsiroseomonas frigidaquae]